MALKNFIFNFRLFVFSPYAFNGHTSNCERPAFDSSPNGSAQTSKTSSATSLSPPPISHSTGKNDGIDPSRFNAGKFIARGPNSTSVHST